MQETIMNDLKAAMKSGEKQKVEVLRMVKTALQMAAIDNKDMSEADEIKILQKEAKKRRDAAEMFRQGGNETQAEAELEEAGIIDTYLPEQMSEEEIEAIVDDVVSQNEGANMGQIMGAVMPKVAGKADGSAVSRIVKEKMQ